MNPQERTTPPRDGFTLIELLIGIAVLAVLSAVAVPAYLGFIQRARETALIHYLKEIHAGQMAWRLETDAPGFSGDFDELEESGFIVDARNFQRVRRRAPSRGPTRATSSRLVQNYRLDLTAQDDTSTNTHTYSLVASPQSGNRKVRWFYLDHTGLIRAGIGQAGPSTPPAT
jgi:prepilin-type N-terminal cleavage/methylation domain-containing protein